jgi:hypothetical protein
MDYVMGTLGLVLDAAVQPSGTLDFAALDADKLDEAVAFITQPAMGELIAAMSPDDPMQPILMLMIMYAVSL